MASHTLSAKPARRNRAVTITLWVLQALMAFMFAFAGVLKLMGDPTQVDLFARIGIGQWLRYAVGTLELAGAVGLLVPLLSGLAALGLAGVMVGATLISLFVTGDAPWMPLGYLLVLALVAWGRGARTRALLGRVTR